MMRSSFDRRSFLQTSLAGVASLSSLHGVSILRGAEGQGVADPVLDEDAPQFRKGDPDTLFLTWLRDPTTTIAAVWVGQELPDDEVEVRCSALEGDSWNRVKPVRRPYPAGGLSVYQAEVTGLTPGSQYKLRIGKGKVDHLFQTMPAKATSSFQFVSGGDSGARGGSRGSNVLAAKQDPMFVLMGGDIAYDNGVRTSDSLRFLKHYREDLVDSSKRLIPIVPVIGNHEIVRVDERDTAPFFSALYGGLYADKPYNTLDFGDYLSLVLLDTGHMARISGEQTSWLDGQLAARRDMPHLIAAQHVPSYPSIRPFDKQGEDSRKHWVPLFEKHNVDLVLEHHDHTFKRTHPLKDGLRDKRGLVYLGDGSWGRVRALQDPEKRPYLAAAASNYHVTLHRLEGEQRFHMALTEAGRVVDICTTQKRPLHSMGKGA